MKQFFARGFAMPALAIAPMLSFAATLPSGMTSSRTNSPGDSLFVGQPAGPLSGTASAATTSGASLAVGVDLPSFTAVKSMTLAHETHTATLPPSGSDEFEISKVQRACRHGS